MKITVNLEDMWCGDDYSTYVASMIRDEVQAAIRREIKTFVSKEVKAYLEHAKKVIAKQITAATPGQLKKLMEAFHEVQ